jgi:Domain of unknown function (DUF4383)
VSAHPPADAPTAFDRGRSPAQWYCLLAGLSLLLAGVLGFIADSSFETGDDLQGGSFIGFEVNAIHNLIHLASGLVLLAAARARGSARAVAIGFGLVYGIVAIVGIADGSDVLGLIPINSADNVLHVGLAGVGIIAGLMSRDADRGRSDTLVDREIPGRFDRESRSARDRARR